ncbi:MAG: hypothetical protein NTU79_17015 [Planctomycetota bacterium]|nr:hypothetical protein [Planctomycetota bacterium]
MSSPIKMKIVRNGFETTVYSKRLSDNLIASRIETFSPIATVAITIGSEIYEIYPEKKQVIDAGFLLTAANDVLNLARKIQPPNNLFLQGLQGPFDLLESAEHEGIHCWKLITKMPEELYGKFINSNSILTRENFPIEKRVYIDKISDRILFTEEVSISGRVLARVHFKEIEKMELPDDLFLIPQGYELLRPASLAEYVIMKRELAGRAIFGPTTGTIDPSKPWERFGMDESEFLAQAEARKIRKKLVAAIDSIPKRGFFQINFLVLASCVGLTFGLLAMSWYLARLRSRRV